MQLSIIFVYNQRDTIINVGPQCPREADSPKHHQKVRKHRVQRLPEIPPLNGSPSLLDRKVPRAPSCLLPELAAELLEGDFSGHHQGKIRGGVSGTEGGQKFHACDQ